MIVDTRTCGEISCDECNERYEKVCEKNTILRDVLVIISQGGMFSGEAELLATEALQRVGYI